MAAIKSVAVAQEHLAYAIQATLHGIMELARSKP